MATYGVAKAKNRLPALIDKAIAGEEVVITPHGRPIAELHPTRRIDPPAADAAQSRLRARRDAGAPLQITSVELLRQIYEDQ